MGQLETILKKITDWDEAGQRIAQWQSHGESIVFTNGCFDIVHRGHVEYLAKAADLGHRLVIGLNTDKSVSRLKGAFRPLVDEESRAILLAGLQFVDIVVYFEEDTPYELIKKLQPDVLVKGADYRAEDIVGYDVVTGRGGRVETISFVEGFSTTLLVQKLKESL
jgi:rfaE bifunctional protein nucleotidyltransferase chain/domain